MPTAPPEGRMLYDTAANAPLKKKRAAARLGNFAKCSSRFAGKPKEDVEAFVNAITVCKECVDISDDNALKGLPMLLNDLAATWFQGSKSLHKTWTEAVAALQNAFGKKLPPHRVF
jgi:hypothetical protein